MADLEENISPDSLWYRSLQAQTLSTVFLLVAQNWTLHPDLQQGAWTTSSSSKTKQITVTKNVYVY
jgi:hypothetical protein